MLPSAHSNPVLRYGAALALTLTALSAHAGDLHPILGGGLGAMAGAYIGQSVGGRDGALIGAAVGGVAGVSIASHGERQRQETAHTVVSAPQHRPPQVQAPVYGRPVYTAPVVVVPAYRYRAVERTSYYYPVRDHGRRSWGEHGRSHGERPWGQRDNYRHNDQGERGGEHRGWDRRD